MLNLPVHPGSPEVFSWIRVPQSSLGFCIVFCRSLFAIFLLSIVSTPIYAFVYPFALSLLIFTTLVTPFYCLYSYLRLWLPLCIVPTPIYGFWLPLCIVSTPIYGFCYPFALSLLLFTALVTPLHCLYSYLRLLFTPFELSLLLFTAFGYPFALSQLLFTAFDYPFALSTPIYGV